MRRRTTCALVRAPASPSATALAIAPALRFYRAYFAFAMADPAIAAPPYPGLYPLEPSPMLRRSAMAVDVEWRRR